MELRTCFLSFIAILPLVTNAVTANEKPAADTLELASFGLNELNPDNAGAIRRGIQTAIDMKIPVVAFPKNGKFRIESGSYWTVNDDTDLLIEGRGATIEVGKNATAVSQETYVLAFKCAALNSVASKITIRNVSIKAPEISPQWTETNYQKHRLVIALETDGFQSTVIENCYLSDIYGYGIRLKNFLKARISRVSELNVGGHFPIENEHDSFGDGIWLGHYDVQTVRSSRKESYAEISNCTIKAYSTAVNGNFASRCGLTVEGFNSYAPDIIVKVDVNNCSFSDYDRSLHVEGISSNIKYTDSSIRNFFGLALVVKSTKTALEYDQCTVSGLLPPNPAQQRLGLGGAMQFDSYFDLMVTNNTSLAFNRPATFRANIYLQNGSTLDFGNSDIFFDHANLYIKNRGALINIPARVPRGFNMYGGKLQSDWGIFKGYRNKSASFNGENMEAPMIEHSALHNVKIRVAGGFGVREIR